MKRRFHVDYRENLNCGLLNCRSRWLKEPDADSNELFRMVAEIFILWCKSHVSS